MFYTLPTAKVIRRWSPGLKSHPKDWRSPGSNSGPLVYKAGSLTARPRRPPGEKGKKKKGKSQQRKQKKRSIWAAYLSALLKGRELDRLSVADTANWDKLKDAILRNFDRTECGFRKK